MDLQDHFQVYDKMSTDSELNGQSSEGGHALPRVNIHRVMLSRLMILLILASSCWLGSCSPNSSRSASARAAYPMPGFGAAPKKKKKVKTKKYKQPKTVRERSKSGRDAARHSRESLSF